MPSYSFVIDLKPGAEADYKRRHDEIWPDMRRFLSAAGFKNYHIFRHGSTLFAYFECDDFERLIRQSETDETNQSWQAYMQDIISLDTDPETGFPKLLEEMFSHP